MPGRMSRLSLATNKSNYLRKFSLIEFPFASWKQFETTHTDRLLSRFHLTGSASLSSCVQTRCDRGVDRTLRTLSALMISYSTLAAAKAAIARRCNGARKPRPCMAPCCHAFPTSHLFLIFFALSKCIDVTTLELTRSMQTLPVLDFSSLEKLPKGLAVLNAELKIHQLNKALTKNFPYPSFPDASKYLDVQES